MKPPEQAEFDFAAPTPAESGFEVWRRQRLEAMRDLARKVGLPLGHRVEVRLVDDVVVRGSLRLREEVLVLDALDLARLEFEVDGLRFRHAEIAAVVRLD